MSYEFYKIIHVLGVILLFASLGGLASFKLFASKETHRATYRTLAIVHGLSLMFLLVAGFGLLARLGLANDSMPTWIYGKLAIWLAAGGAIAVIKKGRLSLLGNLIFVSLIGVCATWLAVFKP